MKIADKITANLDALMTAASNILPRHRSLSAAFNVSWQMLTPDEQRLFSVLSVFRGGFDLKAAQEIAGATPEMLAALVNQSLLRFNPTSGRYEMYEALRQYAGEQLSKSGNPEEVRNAHARFYSLFLSSRYTEQAGNSHVSPK